MLRKGRWMSVVFQHWNTAYFEAIFRAAAEHHAELRTAISQVGDPIWSMHKKKSSESVLAGEMILTFFNGGSEKRKLDPAFSVGDSLRTILRQNPQEYVYGEQIFNELIVAAWRAGAVRTLRITKDEFLDLLKC